MKLEQALLILITLVVVILGFIGIVWIAYGSSVNACPAGSIYTGGVCCQDLNNDGRCDVVSQTLSAPSPMTVSVETGPSDQDVIIAKLTAAVTALETKSTKQSRPGYQCDDYGCRRMSNSYGNSYGYNSYFGYDDYGYNYDRYDRYDRDRRRNRDDEWDLTIRVIDADNGDEIDDAKVRIENGDDDTEFTDRDGEAEFRNIEEDCYDIKVTHPDYETEHDDICVSRDRIRTIRMEPEH